MKYRSIFWEKEEKYPQFVVCSTAEIAQGVAKVKLPFKIVDDILKHI